MLEDNEIKVGNKTETQKKYNRLIFKLCMNKLLMLNRIIRKKSAWSFKCM